MGWTQTVNLCKTRRSAHDSSSIVKPVQYLGLNHLKYIPAWIQLLCRCRLLLLQIFTCKVVCARLIPWLTNLGVFAETLINNLSEAFIQVKLYSASEFPINIEDFDVEITVERRQIYCSNVEIHFSCTIHQYTNGRIVCAWFYFVEIFSRTSVDRKVKTVSRSAWVLFTYFAKFLGLFLVRHERNKNGKNKFFPKTIQNWGFCRLKHTFLFSQFCWEY